MKLPVFALALALCVSLSAGEGVTTIVNPEWTLSDDFESTKDSSFWGSGTAVVYGARSKNAKSKVLQFTYMQGKPDMNNGWAEQRFRIPLKAQQLEISYRLYVPANYKNSGKNHKGFVLWSGRYGKVRANISVSSENWGSEGGATPSIYIGCDKKNFGHTMLKKRTLMLKDRKAEWIDIHVYLELARKPGSFGRFEIYRNGKMITGTHHPGLADDGRSWRPPAPKQIGYSHMGNYIDQGYLLGWMNGGVQETTQFLIDDFRIKASSRIGKTAKAKTKK